MKALECIKSRRSVRKFTEQPVTAEEVAQIVEYAAYAPSWKNTQSTRYTAVLDPELKKRIAEDAVNGFAWNTKIMEGAPALVVVTTVNKRAGYEKDGSFSTSKGTHWQSFDAGIASQTFCLAAHAKGFGTVILGVFDEAKVAEILGLDESESVSALIPLGHPAEDPNAPKRKTAEDLLRVR